MSVPYRYEAQDYLGTPRHRDNRRPYPVDGTLRDLGRILEQITWIWSTEDYRKQYEAEFPLTVRQKLQNASEYLVVQNIARLVDALIVAWRMDVANYRPEVVSIVVNETLKWRRQYVLESVQEREAWERKFIPRGRGVEDILGM